MPNVPILNSGTIQGKFIINDIYIEIMFFFAELSKAAKVSGKSVNKYIRKNHFPFK
jgi:hypothetical protein